MTLKFLCCVKKERKKRKENLLLFFSLSLGYFPIILFFLQYGLLYPGGSWPRSPLFSGGPLGNHSSQCRHAAPAPAFFLEDCPAESRLALQGSPFPVSKCKCVWSSWNEPEHFPCYLLVLLLNHVCLFSLISCLFHAFFFFLVLALVSRRCLTMPKSITTTPTFWKTTAGTRRPSTTTPLPSGLAQHLCLWISNTVSLGAGCAVKTAKHWLALTGVQLKYCKSWAISKPV